MNAFINEYYKCDNIRKLKEIPLIKEYALRWIDYILQDNKLDSSTIESFRIKRKQMKKFI